MDHALIDTIDSYSWRPGVTTIRERLARRIEFLRAELAADDTGGRDPRWHELSLLTDSLAEIQDMALERDDSRREGDAERAALVQ